MFEESSGKIADWARILVDHSIEVDEGDEVYLLGVNRDCEPLFRKVRDEIISRGGIPLEHFVYDSQIASGNSKEWLLQASQSQLERSSEAKKAEIREADKYIRIGRQEDMAPGKTVDPEKQSKWEATLKEIFQIRLSKDWVTTRYPTQEMADRSGISVEELGEEIISAAIADYDAIHEKNQKLKSVLDSADRIRVKDGETDLEFSIKGRKGINCYGRSNVPDGEVYFAPVKESVNGKISFEHPVFVSETEIAGITLWFEGGEVVDFEAEKNEERLKSIIETDSGSRFLGEFGIGTNSQRQKVVGETLMDEKIEGTIHLALGNAYPDSVPEEAERNDSSVHMDIIKDLRKESGGGTLLADDREIMKDGEWKIQL